MTRISRPPGSSGAWSLQDAKARFSEVVRRARSDGPQRVTVHGREEVVIVGAEDYRRLKGEQTGRALIAALQACPDRDFAFGSAGERSPVRDVDL